MNARGCVSMASLVLGGVRTRMSTILASQLRLVRSQTTSARKPRGSSSYASQSSASPAQPSDENGEKVKEKPLQNPRNDAIPYAVVRLVNRETGSLDPPARLRDILKTLNRKKEYLELVVEQPEPIVKVINTAVQYQRKQKKREAKAHNPTVEDKEMQVTWRVGESDLRAKLVKTSEELLDGNRVSVVYAPKKGQPIPTVAEQEKTLEDTVQTLAWTSRERQARVIQKNIGVVYLESLRPRKQVHELVWAYDDDEPWVGLNTVKTALQRGARVDLTFVLTPPLTKLAKGEPQPPPPSEYPGKELMRCYVDVAVDDLVKTSGMAREYKPRDIRKDVIVAYLEGYVGTSRVKVEP